MQYAPHTLQTRPSARPEADEYGRPVLPAPEEEWVDVCRCRCDHNSTERVALPDGTLIAPQYAVSCGVSDPGVQVGDYARCVRDDGSVRGEGRVCNVQTLNYLPYAKVYLRT